MTRDEQIDRLKRAESAFITAVDEGVLTVGLPVLAGALIDVTKVLRSIVEERGKA